MRSLTYIALTLPAMAAAQDMVVATIDGKVQSWVNNYFGPGVAAPSPNVQAANAVQPSSPPPVVPSTTSPVYQAPSSTSSPPPPVSTSSSTSVAAPAPSPGTGSYGGNSGNGGTGGNGPSEGTKCNGNQQSIKLTNNAGKDLHIVAGPPYTVGECGIIPVGSTCEFCQERDPAGGNLQIGYGMPNSRATWLEGNWIPDGDEKACVDISYIPGYSVPVTCQDTVGNTVGLPDSLCDDESCSNCGNTAEFSYKDGACLNPMGSSTPGVSLIDGPAPAFFSIATGKAYTFPNDNGAVVWDKTWNKVTCIAHPQYGNGSSKRSVDAPVDTKSKRETHAHSHISKKQRRHQHRHGVHAGSKI